MYRHQLVRGLVAHFAEAASVDRRIRVFTRPGNFQSYMAHRGGLTEGEKIHLRRGHAYSIFRKTTPHEVFVTLARHAKVDELTDSAAHEVTHLRWPSLDGCNKQGSLFDIRVKALLAGYRCGPPGSRLPAAFRKVAA